jgi:hypothetical protein
MHGLVTDLVALRTTSPTMEDYDTRYYAVNTRGRGRSRNDTSISMADLFEAIILFVLLALLVLIWVACTFVIFVTSVAYSVHDTRAINVSNYRIVRLLAAQQYHSRSGTHRIRGSCVCAWIAWFMEGFG